MLGTYTFIRPLSLTFPGVGVYVREGKQCGIFFLAAFRRRQTEEHILCTVNRYNSLMDQWITSCGSQSIGLLLSKHAAESVGREIWAAGVEVYAFLRIDKHIDRTLIEQQQYQLFF